MDYEIRPVTDDEYPAFSRSIESAFGYLPNAEEEVLWRKGTEFDRTLAAFDAGEIVATAAAITMEQTLPGLTSIPVAGVTAVGVASTHRRRGLLTRLMDRQLDDVAARGESVALLTASESVIYGRFGYGWATSHAQAAIETDHSRFAVPLADTGRIRRIDAETAVKVLPALHERIRRLQPGDIWREPVFWEIVAADFEHSRDDAGPQFWAVHESESGEPDGFTRYRFKSHSEHGLPESTLLVTDLMAVSPDVEAALCRYVLDIDLVRHCRFFFRPADDPFRRRLADPRRYRVEGVFDHVWARLLDIPAALSARRYTSDGEVVIEVHDAFRPANTGRYLLEGSPEGAMCMHTRDEADIAVGVEALGAAFLGGVSFASLAAAGQVEERKAGGIRRADALFLSSTAPFCRTGF